MEADSAAVDARLRAKTLRHGSAARSSLDGHRLFMHSLRGVGPPMRSQGRGPDRPYIKALVEGIDDHVPTWLHQVAVC